RDRLGGAAREPGARRARRRREPGRGREVRALLELQARRRQRRGLSGRVRPLRRRARAHRLRGGFVSEGRKYALVGGVAAVIVVLDQLTKLWVDSTFRLYQTMHVFSWLNLTYVR